MNHIINYINNSTDTSNTTYNNNNLQNDLQNNLQYINRIKEYEFLLLKTKTENIELKQLVNKLMKIITDNKIDLLKYSIPDYFTKKINKTNNNTNNKTKKEEKNISINIEKIK